MFGKRAAKGDKVPLLDVPVSGELAAAMQRHVQPAWLLRAAVFGDEDPALARHAMGGRVGNEITLVEFDQLAAQR